MTYDDILKNFAKYRAPVRLVAVIGEKDAITAFATLYNVRVDPLPPFTGHVLASYLSDLQTFGPEFMGMDHIMSPFTDHVGSACEVTLEGTKLTLVWANFISLDTDVFVFDMASLHAPSIAATLPPAKMWHDLPPPSPQYEASISRWCDFDGEYDY